MTHRLLSALFVAALAVPSAVVAKPPDLPEDGTITVDRWGLHQLHPTARRTLAGSMLFGIHPALALLPTDKALDAPCDHPQPPADDFLTNLPKHCEYEWFVRGGCGVIEDIDWWKWLLSNWTVRQQSLPPEQNEGYVHALATAEDFAYLAVNEPPAEDNDRPSPPTIEVLPMPCEDGDITCPYLRQQMQDRHAAQLADPEMSREVLDNLERLENADKLLQLAKDLADAGDLEAAVECCLRAEALCPGSPCAEHAVDTLLDLMCGIAKLTTATEEVAEQQSNTPSGLCCQGESFWEWLTSLNGPFFFNVYSPEPSARCVEIFKSAIVSETKADAATTEPGVEQAVCGLMKACHLLMNQGMYHQAAELARQAFALDPQRVRADPLIYQMHLLAESSPSTASEPSEPPTCPYCPSAGKPIRDIVPEEKNDTGPETLLVPSLPPIDYEVVPALDEVLTESAKEDRPSAGAEEASEDESAASAQDLIEMLLGEMDLDVGTHADGGLRLCGEWAVGSNVYHVRYSHGSLQMWKTPDASKSEYLRQIEYEWERIWFTDMPSRLTPERVHGGICP